MSSVENLIPRSTLSAPAQRRLGALQAAKVLVTGDNHGYRKTELDYNKTQLVMRMAVYIDSGEDK